MAVAGVGQLLAQLVLRLRGLLLVLPACVLLGHQLSLLLLQAVVGIVQLLLHVTAYTSGGEIWHCPGMHNETRKTRLPESQSLSGLDRDEARPSEWDTAAKETPMAKQARGVHLQIVRVRLRALLGLLHVAQLLAHTGCLLLAAAASRIC